MIVIADSGSTSVDWRTVDEKGRTETFRSEGVNPVFQDGEVLRTVFSGVASRLHGKVRKICFYGAGVLSPAIREKMTEALAEAFLCRNIVVESDLVAAARALFGSGEGIAAILGTGSNSGLYDGRNIVANVRAGGFILGDEGSGASLGKGLLSDFIKGLLPEDLSTILRRDHALDYATVVDRVYRGKMPSRYLASFSVFLKEHETHPYVQKLLSGNFRNFFERNILFYRRPDLKVSIVGSVAVAYEDVIRKVAAEVGLEVGTVVKSAADGLAAYHLSELNHSNDD